MAPNVKCINISLIFFVCLFLYVNGIKDKLCDEVEVKIIGKTESVKTKYGKVVGQILTNRLKATPKTSVKKRLYSSFRGIRYAQPPTGEKRFLVSL